jgi:predicted ATPase
MKLTIENLGPIGRPTIIDFENLTVIAGENDCGKSTIGKVAFSVIKAFSNYPAVLKENQYRRIRRTLEMIALNIRHKINLANYPNLRVMLREFRSLDLLEAPFMQICAELNNIIKVEPDHTELLERQISKIKNIQKELNKNNSAQDAISNSIFEALRSEFSGEITNKFNVKDARITLADGETKVFDITLNNDRVTSFEGGDVLGYSDATFVDGPGVFQYKNTVNVFDSVGVAVYSPRRNVPFHISDLYNKLQAVDYKNDKLVNEDLSVNKVYNGYMYYDEKDEEFYLNRGGFKVSSSNTASGIKAMSILRLLLKHEFVQEDTLLILDEPETNLHPKWQIEYSKTLCELAEQGAKIIVTSHSPYIVESLKAYGEKSKANFYLAKRTKTDDVEFMNTFGDITSIIDALTQPLIDMMDDSGNDF